MIVDHRISIQLGALARPLAEQLDLPAEAVLHYQADSDAITRLAIRGLLTERETHSARKRLVKAISTDRTLPWADIDEEEEARCLTR